VDLHKRERIRVHVGQLAQRGAGVGAAEAPDVAEFFAQHRPVGTLRPPMSGAISMTSFDIFSTWARSARRSGLPGA
jgi:hypothetical protein